ncbi:MAG TPA: hypothetical protein VI322_03230 [Candidatus Saccharimonadia bacterium]
MTMAAAAQDRTDPAYVAGLEAELARLRAAQAKPSRRDPRSWLAWLCLLLGLVLLVPANILIWENRTIADRAGYMQVVAPLVHEPTVQKALSKAAGDALQAQVDVAAVVRGALPDNAQFLAEPIAIQVQAFAQRTIDRIVTSSQFADLWVAVNERAHDRYMQAAASGRTSPTLNVQDLYTFVSGRLADTPLAVLAGRELPARVGEIPVVTVPALAQIPQLAATLNDVRWWCFGLGVALLLAALALSRDRRRWLVAIGWGWLGVAAATALVMLALRATLLGRVTDPIYHAAAVTVWQAFLAPLVVQVVVLAATGLVLVGAGWLFGPADAATALRRRVQRSLGLWRRQWWPAFGDGAVAQFLRRWHVPILWAWLVVALMLALWWAPLTLGSLLGIVAIVAVGLVVVEFLAAPEV